MLVVDLHCEQGHVFEGWFACADDLGAQKARGLVSCPVCGSIEVTRRPSASRLNVRAAGEMAEPQSGLVQGASGGASATSVEALQAMYLQAVRHVLQHTEDVGNGFAREVRNIHRGDAPQRAVRGQADQAELTELKEEGIDVVSMPIPQALKEPLQ